MNVRLIFLYLLTLCFTTSHQLHADVVTDGSVGAAQSLTGPDYAIPETLGTIKGNNLFHSFEEFSLKTEESATFTGSDSIQNVISRVTGGQRSDIDGTLRSNVGKADFYFINPSGVVFGPNAKVDVPAAFHLSTADELKFTDGTSFKASKSEQSTLTQAPPESFGFLGAQSASIEINGSTLVFAPESKVSLTSSKDITITETENKLTGLVNPASLVSDGGDISLIAKKDLSMNGAKIDASGNGAGKVVAKANNITIANNSTISSYNTGSMNSDTGGIEIVADSNLELTQGSRIQSNVSGSGDSGTIRVQAENLLIKQQEREGLTGVLIEVEPEATGNGKKIDVNVSNSLKIEGVAGIASSTSGFGDAASVNVTAGQLQMDGQGRDLIYRDTHYIAGIASNALENSYGNTSDVSVYVDNLLEMTGGCGISSYSSGMGDGSNVSIKAGDMNVDGSTANNYLTIIATSSTSEGKNVRTNIQVDGQLELLGGAKIYSETSLHGDAGEVSITAGSLRIDNKGLAEKYTGIWSDTYSGSGNAGKINIAVTGLMELLNGANISSSTFSEGNAGDISITAGQFKIDHQGINNQSTGIWSNAYSGSKGDAGKVEIKVSGLLEILSGARVSSSTWSDGDAGEVSISADDFRIDNQGLSNQVTGIWSETYSSSTGNAGEVAIEVSGLLELLNGARISSSTYSNGDAGTVKITSSDQLNIINRSQILSETYSNSDAGKIEVAVSGPLNIENGSIISSSTYSQGSGGEVLIDAGAITIDNQGILDQYTGIWSDANPLSKGDAGTVEVRVSENLELLNGAQISSATYSQGNAGIVNINVSGMLDIINGAHISSDTYSYGNGNKVLINAGSITIDNQGILDQYTGIWSDAELGSQGDAGTVEVTVKDQLEILNGAQISSETASQGSAGSLKINAGKIRLDGKGSSKTTGILNTNYYSNEKDNNAAENSVKIEIEANDLIEILNGAQIMGISLSQEDSSNIKLTAKALTIDGQGNNGQATGIKNDNFSNFGSKAGNINIIIDGLTKLLDGAQISSSTTSKGNAGDLTIIADNLIINDKGNKLFTGIFSDTNFNEGNAGAIFIEVKEQCQLLNGAWISNNTTSKGNAGHLNISAQNLKLDGQDTIILSGTFFDYGDAGKIDIEVSDLLEIVNGATISTNTSSQGNAGDISIDTKFLIADSGYIESASSEDATGYVGTININADSIKMMNKSRIDIIGLQTISEEQLANIPDKSIIVQSKEFLMDGSYIYSMSTQNVPASSINIQTDKLIVSNNAVISSGANMADGGDIDIQGGNIFLYDSLITTSVKGENGDGGDITINGSASPYESFSDGFLIMQGGFIQANTAGKGNSGGEIDINIKGVIADKTQELNIGGNERQQFEPGRNVIQSAAPDGYPGEINISGVQLDISGSIINMDTQFSDELPLATDLCQNIGTEMASSLIQMGQGGLPEMPSDLSSISFSSKMVDELLLYQNSR